jgi:hypothetical protein
MTLYDTIILVCGVITAIGTPISIWIGILNRRANQIQHEQTGEYREQTEIMRAQAAGAPVPARIHSLPSASAQLSWFRRQGALPYGILAAIFSVASAGLFYAYSHAPIQSLHGTIAIAQNSHEVSVAVDANPPYEVLATPNWNTNVWPEKRDKGQFSLGFNTPAPSDAVVDWEVIPLPVESKAGKQVSEQLAARDEAVRTLQQEVGTLHDELNDLKATQWPTLKAETIRTLTISLAKAGHHEFDLFSCPSSDCDSFSDGFRQALHGASWYQRPHSVSQLQFKLPSGWVIAGYGDKAGMDALHDAIKETLHVDVPTLNYPVQPKTEPYVQFMIGPKPKDLRLSQQ